MQISLDDYLSLCVDEKLEDFSLIQSWIDDEGKYQYQNNVVLHIPSRKFYMHRVQRSGSWFSEYHYEYDEDENNKITLQEVSIMPIQAFVWQIKRT